MKTSILIILMLFAGLTVNAKDSLDSDRKKIQQQLEASLDQIKSDIQDLKQKSISASGDVKADMKEQIANLEKDEVHVRQKLSSLGKSSGKAWNEVKKATEEAFDKLKSGFKKAKNRLLDK